MRNEHERNQTPWHRRLPRGTGFYLALSLAVVALGIGVWGTVNSALRGNQFQQPTTPRTTISWDQFTTQPTHPAELETQPQPVVEPVRDAVDDRETTEEPTTTRSDNLPFTGNFTLPFGTNIIKDFSGGQMVRSVTMGDWRVHNGVDFGGERDQPVLAIQDGIVQSVSTCPLWGVQMEIDHGHGVVARYAGLQAGSTPREGREVRKGEPIAIIGDLPVGASQGIHLHLEIRVNGEVQDPLAVMNRSN